MVSIRDIIRLIRPAHWIKNVVVLLPVVFGQQMASPEAWGRALWAAVAFCLASSATYVLNDIADRQGDRQHPTKRDRPLAAGRVPVHWAAVLGAVLGPLALLFTVPLHRGVTIVLAAYLGLQILYTVACKHRVLLDVICIALGFVLRAVGGAVAIRVAISPWLFICMFTLCLFMGFCKRYSEIVSFEDAASAGRHRATLLHYTPELLTHLVTVSAGIAVVAFLVYSLNERTIEHFGTPYFVYTLPLMVYGVFRFAMLSMNGRYNDPTDLILHDLPFQITVALWLGAAVLIVGWGESLHDYLQGQL